jgi:ribonuclease P/MRP protein subunit RPP40
VLSPCQHGFVGGRSTETNLVTISQFLYETLDNHSQVYVVYTDFSKAFDMIDRDHNLLLNKLESFGFSDDLVLLVKSYLDSRLMCVKLKGFESRSFKQETGVLQGSVLGPLFFNIFINDLVASLDISCLLYADDIKIYTIIDTVSDSLRLQRGIDEIADTCRKSGLIFNFPKCSVATFTKKVKPLLFDYTLNNKILLRRSSVQDLGVLFDSKLSFCDHILSFLSMTSAAFKSLGFVLRSAKEFGNVVTLKLLYITYVRSKLEYASLVWSPIHNIYIAELERVQRRFLKSSIFMLDGLYPPRDFPQELLLDRLGLQSLSNRRLEHSVIFLYKLLHGSLHCPALL